MVAKQFLFSLRGMIVTFSVLASFVVLFPSEFVRGDIFDGDFFGSDIIIDLPPGGPMVTANYITLDTFVVTSTTTKLSVSTNVQDTITYVIDSAPTHGDLSEIGDDGSVTYTPNFTFIGTDSFTYKAFVGLLESNIATVTINVAAAPCSINCFSNILFLPGIESSRLYRPDYNGGTDQLWEPNINDDVRDLYLLPDGETARSDIYAKENDVVNELPVLKQNIYKSFIAKLNYLKDNKLIEDWKPIAYDWRLSLDDILNYGHDIDGRIYYSGDLRATSTPYIIQELRHLSATSKSGKVTIIAHSNGGLVAKRLTEILGAEASNFIDKIIFVAVPQAGTPMAVAAGLHGYEQDHLWGLITSEATARTFANNSPMEYQLIPSAQYFKYVADPVITFDSTLPDWIAKYGKVIHSKETLHTYLTDSFGRVNPETGGTNQPIQFNDTLLSNAEMLHADLDNWKPPDGVELIQIAGWGIPKTVSGITYKKKGAGVEPEPNFTIDGDGTVVVPSALWTSTTSGATNYWVNLRDYNTNHPFSALFGHNAFDHSRILEVDSVLSLISDLVEDTSNYTNTYGYLTNETPPSTDKRLQFALHSPLTFNLYDDQGRHTGISTTTNQVEEQIPGTYYQEFGDIKYIFADESASFHILMEGTGTGTFTFVLTELQGNTAVASTTFQDLPVTSQTKAMMNISTGLDSASNLIVDENGDGTSILSYASSTGALLVPVAPVPVTPAPVSSGGGGIPSLLSRPINEAIISTTTTSSTSIVTDLVPTIEFNGVSTSSTSTVILVRRPASPTQKIVSAAEKPVHVVAKRNAQSQVAAVAQTVAEPAEPERWIASLWSLIYRWIISKLHW